MNIKTAKEINLTSFLAKLGFEPVKRKNHQVWFKSPFRNERTASFKVDESKNFWYDFGEGIGGTIIDFVLRLKNTESVSESLNFIKEQTHSALGKRNFSFQKQKPVIQYKEPKRDIQFFELKSKALIGYLKSRGISEEFKSFLKFGLEKKQDKKYFYLAFKNDKGGYELRNEYFKGSLHPKAITTFKSHLNAPIFVFEGFFDFLSLWEITKQQKPEELSILKASNFLVLNSVVNTEAAIETLQQYNDIRLYLDNDIEGKKNTQKIISSLPKAKDYSGLYEEFKDLNEFLQVSINNNHKK